MVGCSDFTPKSTRNSEGFSASRAQELGEKVLAIAMTWGEAGARAEDAAVERGGNTRCPRIYGTQVHGGNKQAKGLMAARLAGRQGWCGRRSSTGDRGQEVDS